MSNEKINADTAIAVSVITGFLGSGKTTLLNYLLQHPEIDETARRGYKNWDMHCWMHISTLNLVLTKNE